MKMAASSPTPDASQAPTFDAEKLDTEKQPADVMSTELPLDGG
jgi:hypothetical protein